MRRIGLIRCPYCGSSSVRLSHRKTLWEKISFLFLLRYMRCRGCLLHYYRPLFTPVRSDRIDRRSGPWKGREDQASLLSQAGLPARATVRTPYSTRDENSLRIGRDGEGTTEGQNSPRDRVFGNEGLCDSHNPDM
jgi:hypothetical protein